MTVSEIQKQQQADLHARLWSIANTLRGTMVADEFKNYILGLIFYRYLSENIEKRAMKLLEEDGISYEEAWQDEEYREALSEELISDIGYFIEPKYLFSSLLGLIEERKFDIEALQGAINNITESTIGHESQQDFDHLFDDMDLTSSKLGRDVKSRSALIAKVMADIAAIPFSYENSEIDVLGDAYEYLIGLFAANAGKKAGEFYTPQQVSKILAKIVTAGKKDLKNVYDPTCGSGSLLLRVGREANVRKFYGQELTATTYNLARMNMLLHGVNYMNFDIRNDDTIEHPQHLDERFEAIVANPPYSAKWSGDAKFLDDERFSAYGKLAPKSKADFTFHLDERFEAIVANPPYSAKWSGDAKFLDDERFSAYGKLAPKSKADFTFIQHMIYQLDDKGTMAVVKWSGDAKFLDDERFSAYGKLAPKSKADFTFIQHMIYQLDDKGTMAVVLPHGVLFRGAAEGVIRKYLIEERNLMVSYSEGQLKGSFVNI